VPNGALFRWVLIRPALRNTVACWLADAVDTPARRPARSSCKGPETPTASSSIDEDFGDIGYRFLIDKAGRIYEGRFSGDDGIPGFDAAGRMVNAAHIAGFNAGNVGIALLGNFVDQAPTIAARRTLTFLLAAIAGWHRIDPLATVHYVNPISGATRTVSAISGHRDWAPTECPGRCPLRPARRYQGRRRPPARPRIR